MALIIGIAEFLVITLLGMFGLWSLVVEIFAIAIVLSFMVLLALEIRNTIQHTYLINEPITYHDPFFPYTLLREKTRVEREQENFKPFVFKEYHNDIRHK